MTMLEIRLRGGTAQMVPLSRRPIKLGRSESCDVVLRDDGEISREHVEVWLDERGRVMVTDLRSKNGTRVDDGDVFRDATRQAQRVIFVGDHELRIAPDGGPAHADGSGSAVFMADAPSTATTTQYFPSTRKLDLNLQRLQLLMSLTERLGGAFDRKQLLEQALNACCDALGFERGMIAVKTARGETELPVTRNIQRDENGVYRVSSTLVNRALIHGERAIVNNPATDLGNLSESMVRFPICSALCVPILNRDEILGVIYGDRTTQAATYRPEDVDFLAAIARQVGLGLANLRLVQEFARSQQIYAELQQARTIQKALLPARALRLGSISIEGFNEPSSAVGGDYFDYFPIANNKIGIVVADVVGHGLPAALIMANLQAAVHVAHSGDLPLAQLAERVNRLICRNTEPHVFITALIGTIDLQSGRIEYVSAGHPAPVLIGDRRSPKPDWENSLPLGIDPGERYEVRSIERNEHAGGVLLYTDGLTEAGDREGRMLGLEPVLATLRSIDSLSAGSILKAVRGVLKRHAEGAKLEDDMTLLAISFVDELHGATH